MNPNFIAGVVDANNHLEDSVTKTGNYAGASLNLGKGFAPGGLGQVMAALITITAMDETSGDETYQFTLEESSDNGNFTACGPPVILTAVAASPVQVYCVAGFVSLQYVRAHLIVGGTTPSITYVSDLIVSPLGVGI